MFGKNDEQLQQWMKTGPRDLGNFVKAAVTTNLEHPVVPIKNGSGLNDGQRVSSVLYRDACPVDAIELTSVYDIVGMTRQEMIFDKSKLLNVYDETVKEEPM